MKQIFKLNLFVCESAHVLSVSSKNKCIILRLEIFSRRLNFICLRFYKYLWNLLPTTLKSNKACSQTGRLDIGQYFEFDSLRQLFRKKESLFISLKRSLIYKFFPLCIYFSIHSLRFNMNNPHLFHSFRPWDLLCKNQSQM